MNNTRNKIANELPYLKNDIRTLNSLMVFLDEVNKICYQINELQNEKTIRIEVVIEDKITNPNE